MAIATTDLVLFASANTPENDTDTAGGNIDLLRRLDFTQLAANDDVEAISTSASDTQSATLTGRSTAGAVVSETKTLTGTTAAIFSVIGVIERVLKFELATAAVGTITVRRSVAGATIRDVPVAERGYELFFYDAASEAAITNRYQKACYKNIHATLTLNNAQVALTADPSAVITFALETAKNATTTSANRKTAPAAVSAFDDAAKSVAGTTLEAGSFIGCWLNMTLAADNAPLRSTFTLQLSGSSV